MNEGTKVAKKQVGFALMTKAKRAEIASLGGKTAHKEGHAHRWTPEEAAAAGRKGAETKAKRRAEKRAKGLTK